MAKYLTVNDDGKLVEVEAPPATTASASDPQQIFTTEDGTLCRVDADGRVRPVSPAELD